VIDVRDTVLGVLTATDVLGEKAMRVSVERGAKRSELIVADLMTPAERVEVIALEDLQAARVGHLLETLRRAGRQHALVVDHDSAAGAAPLAPPVRRAMVRGIVSLSQLARQLGLLLPQAGEVARTFAEIEAALGR
jgi:hypothetical protein